MNSMIDSKKFTYGAISIMSMISLIDGTPAPEQEEEMNRVILENERIHSNLEYAFKVKSEVEKKLKLDFAETSEDILLDLAKMKINKKDSFDIVELGIEFLKFTDVISLRKVGVISYFASILNVSLSQPVFSLIG
ncbi:hypothetical protein C1Y41_04725 [Pantoea sp. ICBG 1758]|uniref:hypothetical protein n=1 Tax=Pantoea sp. ICBG 1758 TaxID=2071682 RepID=UPI000CE43154|nr:hypothetical protein [Pantoea sp. ICBG 1758]PPC63951.1 hypothetical protein C1Y41_04725 [Pantoea sp. ICBG 1758]